MTKCAAVSCSPVLSSSVWESANRARARRNLNLPASELLAAVVGEVLDEGVLAGHHLGEVEADIVGADAPRFWVAGQVQDLGGVEEGFGGHAAAQDAKPADFLAALNDDGFQALGHGGPRGRIPAAAAADDGEVEIKAAPGYVHGGRMREESRAGKARGVSELSCPVSICQEGLRGGG